MDCVPWFGAFSALLRDVTYLDQRLHVCRAVEYGTVVFAGISFQIHILGQLWYEVPKVGAYDWRLVVHYRHVFESTSSRSTVSCLNDGTCFVSPCKASTLGGED
eukprot:c21953_g1_i1 orf=139-450(+)